MTTCCGAATLQQLTHKTPRSCQAVAWRPALGAPFQCVASPGVVRCRVGKGPHHPQLRTRIALALQAKELCCSHPACRSAPHRSAFLAWARHFEGLPRDVAARALALWARTQGWMREHAPFVADTLRPGATAMDVSEAEQALQTDLPVALTAILR